MKPGRFQVYMNRRENWNIFYKKRNIYTQKEVK